MKLNKLYKIQTSVLLIITFSFLFNNEVSGQSISRSRIFTGGNLGLQFGSITLVDVSPIVGYWITDQFAAGVGATYMYYKDDRFSPTYKTDIYGGKIFGRYYPLEYLFAHGEYEILNYKAMIYSSYPNKTDRINITNVLVGGGYEQPIGDYSSFSIMVLWNLNDKPNSLYTNPIIRAGFNIGL